MLKETGKELNDIGRSLSWDALDSFLQYSSPDSAIVREMNPELSEWSSATKTNAILADIFDALMLINANIVAQGSGKPAKKPKPYPRPGGKKPDQERHFGAKPLPQRELHRWIEERRTRHARNSTSHHKRNSGS